MSMRSVYIIKWSYRQIEIVKADHFDVSFRSLFDHQAKWARWALIYVDESWSLWRELSSSLYDHSAERTKWALIYVFVTHVNRSENRKTDRFTALHKCVYAQKLSRVFVMTVWMSYISCSVCAKTLLSFCVYQRQVTLVSKIERRKCFLNSRVFSYDLHLNQVAHHFLTHIMRDYWDNQCIHWVQLEYS